MEGNNWSEWASIAEIVSTFAIVITLIYLTIQTKQNANAIRAGSRDASINTDLQLIHEITVQPEIILNMTKPEISEVEMQQLGNWIIALLRTREHQWFQYQNGVLNEEVWESYLSAFQTTLVSSRARFIWDTLANSGSFDKDFSLTVNEYLAKIPINDSIPISESDFQNR